MRNLYFLFLVFFLVGCVTTETTGFIDPEYKKNGYLVSKVIVKVEKASLEETFTVEQKLVEKFNAYGVETVRFTDIVPPTRSYTPKKEARLLKKTGADSLFTIYVAGRETNETYVPPTYHQGQTTSHINTIGSYSYVTTNTTSGYTTGGYSVSQSMMSSFSSLVDLANGKQIWQAEGISEGNEFYSYLDLLVNAGEEAIDDMQEKGLLPESISSDAKTLQNKNTEK